MFEDKKSRLEEDSFSDEPLLDSEYEKSRHSGLPKGLSLNRRFSVLNVVFFCLNVLLISFTVGKSLFFKPTPEGQLLPLPAREVVKYELRRFKNDIVNNPFSGEPREELETAWHDLLQNDNLRMPKEDLDRLDLPSAHIKNSGDVLASLSVFHALHCLKKVRQMTYKEHYHHGKDAKAMDRETAHSNHCVEYIREYLMCNPDLSFVTYHFINNTAQNPGQPSLRLPTTWDHAQHECVNWDAINGWAGERTFDLYDHAQLDPPKDGLSY